CRVTEIKPYAFYGCSVMSDIDFGEYLISIGDYAFYSNTKLETLTIPDTVEYLGVESFGKDNKISSLTLGNGLKVIDDYAFYGCTHVTEIVIPDSVEVIGKYAFYNCKRATDVTIGSGVKSIGDYAFYGNYKLRYLVIPENVEEVGSYTFKGGDYLTSVVLPSSLTTLGQHVFFGAKITFYTDLDAIAGDWNKRWNSYYRFVVWGCELSEDKSYVTSLTMSDATLTNIHATGELAPPMRKGYTFVGWATTADASTAEYAANELASVPVGTTLYAIWREGEPDFDEIPEPEEDPDDSGTLYI
ncbi:MAG: leucine-rich repeat protein, partial [Clostridia bacterium]|nr:leucine-rich repeat protein [Clostridia bacterium]